MAKAIASGSATIPTITPAVRSVTNCWREYDCNVVYSFGTSTLHPFFHSGGAQPGRQVEDMPPAGPFGSRSNRDLIDRKNPGVESRQGAEAPSVRVALPRAPHYPEALWRVGTGGCACGGSSPPIPFKSFPDGGSLHEAHP